MSFSSLAEGEIFMTSFSWSGVVPSRMGCSHLLVLAGTDVPVAGGQLDQLAALCSDGFSCRVSFHQMQRYDPADVADT